MATLATKNPSGITITRNGNLKFIVSWKVTAKNYNGGQQVRIRAMKNNGKTTDWQQADVSSGTSKAFSFTVNQFNPETESKTIKYIEAEVRGKCAESGKTYDWSGWANKKLTINAPKAPTVTATLDSSNKTTFSWDVETKNDDNRPFVRVDWESMLIKGCNASNGKDLKWKTSQTGWTANTGNASGSRSFTETSISGASYTRWFRIQSRGAGGDTDWKYSKHVYAIPYAPKMKEVTASVKNSTTIVTARWNAEATPAHPIDEVQLQYVFVTPNSGLACPSNASWTTGATVNDTKRTNTISFTIAGTVPVDQCLYVRAVAVHDANERPSDAYLVKKGSLTAPTLSAVTVNSDDHKITVTATHGSNTPPDSFIAVWFESSKKIRKTVVGVIPHNATGTTPAACKCPDWGTDDICVGVQEIQGSYSAKNSKTTDVKTYAIQANMKSSTVWRSGDVPRIPKNVTAEAATDAIGEVIVTWDWTWADSDRAEISWSDNPNAWESTEEPNTYILDRVYSARRRVVGLETGKTWYFAVRLINVTEEGEIYGDYSDILPVNLSSAPNVPIIALSSGVVATGDILTATWEYQTTDGTFQACAEVYEGVESGGSIVPGSKITEVQTAQHADIDTSIWTSDSLHYIMVRVTSESGMESGWSDPVAVYIAEPLVCTITASSITNTNIPNGEGGTRSAPAITAMPFTATITGAGAGGTTTLIIERADEYHMIRPDDSTRDGYQGETVALFRQTGEAAITINKADLIGSLDDGAKYNMIATVEDGYGQSDKQVVPFEVYWSAQAVAPSAVNVVMENGVAKITVTAGASTPANSTVDIYRLSVDKPQLIVQGGAFGTAYVDPYPALGNGGYRAVCMTANGDYITGTDMPAWTDVDNPLDNAVGIINFGGEYVEVRFNTKLSTSWKKDFKETKYLGGTVRGDWNPAISRTSTVNVSMQANDAENMAKMRRLSEYNGLCHVRTQDGSSFTADVQVTNSTGYDSGGNVAQYTLNITRIEPEALDGLPYSEWVVS